MSPAGRESFEPVHEAHAIEQLIAVVHLDRPLSDEAVREANLVMAKFEATLPARAEIRGMGFQVGPLGVMPLAGAGIDTPNGIVRTVSDPRGIILKELRLERQQILFRTTSYTRWDRVWEEAREYFSQLLLIFGDAQVSAYSLVYTDKFIWRGDKNNCSAKLLLRPQSSYITPGIFESSDLWHCHSGRFVQATNKAKRLEVVDLDCIDEVESIPEGHRIVRAVRISTTLTDQLLHPESTATPLLAAQGVNELDAAFVEFHNILKKIFASIITDEMATKVGIQNAS